MKGIRVAALDVPFLNDWETGVPKEFVKEYNKLQPGEYGNISVVQFAKLQGIAVSTFNKYMGILNRSVMR